LSERHELVRWFQLCKALSEYRQGHFASAVDWANKALGSARPLPERDAAAHLVLAMAQRQLKEGSAAHLALDTAKEIINGKLPELDAADLGAYWIDRIIADILLREAEALIKGDPSKTGGSKAEQ
jgi:hypothetical protein